MLIEVLAHWTLDSDFFLITLAAPLNTSDCKMILDNHWNNLTKMLRVTWKKKRPASDLNFYLFHYSFPFTLKLEDCIYRILQVIYVEVKARSTTFIWLPCNLVLSQPIVTTEKPFLLPIYGLLRIHSWHWTWICFSLVLYKLELTDILRTLPCKLCSEVHLLSKSYN